jgi:hypothetical protein
MKFYIGTNQAVSSALLFNDLTNNLSYGGKYMPPRLHRQGIEFPQNAFPIVV